MPESVESKQEPTKADHWKLAYAHIANASEHSSVDGLLALVDDVRSRPRLLIIDDQPVNIQVLNQIFRADHEVYMATSGAQALDVCRKHPPDIILLDIVMPGMDGYAVIKALREDPDTADIPVIFVTAQDSSFDETRAFEHGAVDFIAKPVRPAVVRARIKTHLTIKAQSDLLRSMAFLDGLTGIANRRRFDEHFATEWNASRRHGQDLAVIILDVDHFKQYNDHYGHEQGDRCLQAIARALDERFQRGRDMAARLGGEEFSALLSGTDLDGAMLKAEEIRQAVTALKIPHAASPSGDIVTVSIGVSAARPSAAFTPRDLLKTADQQLYHAKKSGRNQVCGKPLRLA